MNPYYKIGLVLSGVTLLLQLAGFIYFFGFFRGSFQEFKENTIASLRRLEGVFFTDVKVVPHPAADPQQSFAPSSTQEHQPVPQRKR